MLQEREDAAVARRCLQSWYTGVGGAAMCHADPSLGTTDLRFCMVGLMPSPAKGSW